MTMVPAMASCRFLSVVRTMLIDFCAGPRTRTRTRTQVSGAAGRGRRGAGAGGDAGVSGAAWGL